jgi:hypothetical protein
MSYIGITDFADKVALGDVAGVQSWTKFGYNADVDGAEEIIAEFGGTYTPPTTASTIQIVSTSTNDTNSSGTGANNVVVYGIDANRDLVTEVVNMNGTTTVTTTSTWLGINRVAVGLAGSVKSNDGKITVTATTGGATLATLPAGEGTTQQCIFHTPSASTTLIQSLLLSGSKVSGSGALLTFKVWVYSAISNGTYEVYRLNMDTSVSTEIQIVPEVPLVIGADSVIYMTASTNTANTSVAGRFALTIYDD